MQITSSRFGVMEVGEADIVVMPQGLIGFETSKHWVLLSNPKNSAVAWLQSLTQSNLAVPVVSPRRFAPEYRLHISQKDLQKLEMRHNDSIFVLTVVSRSNGILTTNLMSPILLNATRKIAIQTVCTESQALAYPIGTVSVEQVVAPKSNHREVAPRKAA